MFWFRVKRSLMYLHARSMICANLRAPLDLDLDVNGLDPSCLPLDDLAFLGMNHIVVENTVDLGGVAPRRVAYP